ncbi:MAG: hypothetical protein ACRENP_23110 [Longimicrobiales bacterium]
MKYQWCSVLALTMLLSGCSDSATDVDTTISGRWSYNASNIVAGSINCSITGVTINLTQSGSTFSGTTLGGTFRCSAPGVAPIVEDLGSDVIANGQINGNSVTFDISTPDIHNTGTRSGNSISGQITIRLVLSTGVVNLVGSFSAVRS